MLRWDNLEIKTAYNLYDGSVVSVLKSEEVLSKMEDKMEEVTFYGNDYVFYKFNADTEKEALNILTRVYFDDKIKNLFLRPNLEVLVSKNSYLVFSIDGFNNYNEKEFKEFYTFDLEETKIGITKKNFLYAGNGQYVNLNKAEVINLKEYYIRLTCEIFLFENSDYKNQIVKVLEKYLN